MKRRRALVNEVNPTMLNQNYQTRLTRPLIYMG